MAAAMGAQARMGRATLGSVGIHLLAALAIPALAWTASTDPPVETVSFTRILHVEITPPQKAAPPPRAVAPQHAIKTAVTFVRHVPTSRDVLRPHASTEPPVATNAPGAPSVSTVAEAGTGTANGAGVPQATTSPEAHAVSSLGARRDGGYLPFGAQQPDPVLDANVRKSLEALGVRVTIVVAVDENGRTENVAFQPSLDPSLEARIRSMLADASWDPAVCGGGVACEGRATIVLSNER